MEPFKGLASMEQPIGHDLGKDAMVEDWVKQFEKLAGFQVSRDAGISAKLLYKCEAISSSRLSWSYLQILF
ncbi:hypothetical protein Ddye_029548 [Dipteronia dyeriana]|uniref:Uncharacterized protein n=1 Tax=Dipteronia dyeriana TaxID=168575 RepID=A0AAD9WKR5_9ROSI|nr:hypothetical protein Ddye_029548 [Dipteronia dyeriana]